MILFFYCNYYRVGCKRRGGVRFTMRGQGNFNMVILSNVGGSGAVKAVAVRGSRGKTWRQMTRNWGANWQSSGDLRGQRLSFRVTLLDRKTMTFLNVVPSSWWFGQTFSGRGQFLWMQLLVKTVSYWLLFHLCNECGANFQLFACLIMSFSPLFLSGQCSFDLDFYYY